MSSPTTLRLLPELESSLRQLPGVRAVRVVTGPDAKPVEIHVLANWEKAAKQVVRDVQSLAMAEFDLDIDHRIVSVVQLDSEDSAQHPEVVAATRVTIDAITIESSGMYVSATVRLSTGEALATGKSKGPAGANRARVIARATLDAVAGLAELDAAEVDHAQVLRVGGREVAVCTVQFVTQNGEQAVSGSAMVRNDPSDAVARAVLDAVNRRIH
jgi:hypothetical protein